MVRNKTKKNRKPRVREAKKKVGQKKKAKTESLRKFYLTDLQRRRQRMTWIILTICVLFIAGIYWFLKLRKDPELNQVRLTTEQKIKDTKNNWGFKYYNGYKVLTIYNGKVVESSQDSLPEEIRIKWTGLSIKRAKPEELKENPALARIDIPILGDQTFAPPSRILTRKFDRRAGEVIPIMDYKDKKLFMELLEVYENSLLLIFGIR